MKGSKSTSRRNLRIWKRHMKKVADREEAKEDAVLDGQAEGAKKMRAKERKRKLRWCAKHG